MKTGSSVLTGYGTSVFDVMSRLAQQHNSINLGQGFPDQDGPADIREVAAGAIMAGPNQYPPMMGLPELRQAIAAHEARFYGSDVDWQSEVLVTSGGTEAIGDCLLGLIEPGDEVVLIEPLYESYLPMVLRAGGIPKLVRMEPPNWALPVDALRAAFSPRTKLLVLNTPHNPSGKVFTQDELSVIAELLVRYDAFAVCDEVYEHLVYDGVRHVPLMLLPGMRERCLRIGSAGKIFSLTGWKVGFVVGARETLAPVIKAHQFLTFTTAPSLQKAVAFGLAKDDAYFNGLATDLQAKRDRLAQGLRGAGFDVLHSGATYFLTVDIRSVGFNGTDEAFCRLITEEAGVTAVPVSAFYKQSDVNQFARFCFCKRPEVLDEGVARLARFFKPGKA